MNWEHGHSYTRDDIHAALGGSRQTFLPSKNREVVAACLRMDLNPGAPNIMLPGHGQEKQRAADWLSTHPSHVFPVFLKRATNQWEYIGRYCCERWTDAPDEIREWSRRSGRQDIYRILFLKAVD